MTTKHDIKMDAEAIRNDTRRLNVIQIYGGMTMREYGGYNIIEDDFYKMMNGEIEPPRNCFYKNLSLARQRNNKNDRLIVAYMCRGENNTTLHHCFILNGTNIIDHSNLRKKNVEAEIYFKANKIIRYAEIPYNSPDICVTMIGLTARELEKGTIGYTDLQYKNGDWDDAAKKVL
jgi:hypothetical protein